MPPPRPPLDNLINNWCCASGPGAEESGLWLNQARASSSAGAYAEPSGGGAGADEDGDPRPIWDAAKALFYVASLKPSAHDGAQGRCCCDGIFGDGEGRQFAWQVSEGGPYLNANLFVDCACGCDDDDDARMHTDCTCVPDHLNPYGDEDDEEM